MNLTVPCPDILRIAHRSYWATVEIFCSASRSAKHRDRQIPASSVVNKHPKEHFRALLDIIAWPLCGHSSVAFLLPPRSHHVLLLRATTTPNLRRLDAKNSVGLLASACCDCHSRNCRSSSMGMERETR